jgi:hypothetical protein
MSFLAGLVWGILIAAATVALEHYGPSSDPLHISLRGNGAIAVPVLLVPLAIFWGWSWLANAYSGRSALPIAAYTLALLLGVSLIGPADAYFFPENVAGLSVNDLLGGLFQGVLFVGFVAVIAAPIYWVLRSRIGQSRILIWLLSSASRSPRSSRASGRSLPAVSSPAWPAGMPGSVRAGALSSRPS